jgi:uncharacterized protein YlxP (DUF503 family)
VATLGVACVANTHRHCEEVLNEIVAFVQDTRLDAELLDTRSEIVPFEED